MHRNKSLVVVLMAATFGVAACDAVTGSSNGSPIGIGGVAARTKGAGYTTSPAIAFYRVSSATFVSADGVTDSCYIASYSDTPPAGGSSATLVNAGSFISIAIGNRVDSLSRTGGALDATYRSTLTSGIPYTPGDSMVITIPGDRSGFPPSTFRGKTAEPFTMTPLVIPAPGSPIVVNWTPASDPRSAMFVTFRYILPGSTATTFNRQIACSFVDDGSAVVSASTAFDFISSSSHDMIAQRVRTILAQIDVPLAYFNIVSAFDWPTPVSP